jgi:hypothetical protein
MPYQKNVISIAFTNLFIVLRTVHIHFLALKQYFTHDYIKYEILLLKEELCFSSKVKCKKEYKKFFCL